MLSPGKATSNLSVTGMNNMFVSIIFTQLRENYSKIDQGISYPTVLVIVIQNYILDYKIICSCLVINNSV